LGWAPSRGRASVSKFSTVGFFAAHLLLWTNAANAEVVLQPSSTYVVTGPFSDSSQFIDVQLQFFVSANIPPLFPAEQQAGFNAFVSVYGTTLGDCGDNSPGPCGQTGFEYKNDFCIGKRKYVNRLCYWVSALRRRDNDGIFARGAG
jgi:hypothetical protein